MAFLIGGANSLTGGYNIDNSLRFNNDDSPDLAYTPSSAGNRRTFTLSVWFKLQAGTTGERVLLSADDAGGTNDNTNFDYIAINGNDKIFVYGYEGSENQQLKSTQILRDPAAWYHLVVAFDTTQGTAANRVKIYLNGSQVTVFDTANYPDENFQTRFNNTNPHKISRYPDQAASYFDGYMAEYHLIDGSAKAPTDFGEFNDNNVWIPKAYAGTYGTNGFYLEFKQGTGILGDTTGRHLVTPLNGATYNTSVKKFGSSSLYLDNTNNYLNVTNNLADFGFGSGGNSWTIEFWAYYLGNSSSGSDMIVHGDNNSFKINWRPGDPQFKIEVQDTEYAFGNDSPGLSDDTWAHIAIVNESGTLKIYKDGTVDGTTHDVSGKTVGTPNNLFIGYSDADTFDGYIDELRISDIARYTGNFSVQTSVFTSDANTKLLLHMDDNKSFGADTSGQNNHLIPTNLNLLDSTTDTPTNNFCTINPININIGMPPTIAEGNTKFTVNSSANSSNNLSRGDCTIAPSNGKWYVEFKYLSGYTATDGTLQIGVISANAHRFSTNNDMLHKDNGNGSVAISVDNNGRVQDKDGTDLLTGVTTFTVGDTMSVCLDLDNDKFFVGKNGSFFSNGTGTQNPATGANPLYSGGFLTTHKSIGFEIVACGYGSHSSGPSVISYNYGNPHISIDSSNSDANGYGNFEYAVPSGYYSLCTKNLAEFG